MSRQHRLVFLGGTIIDQGRERIEVNAWLYTVDDPPARSFVGRYTTFDRSPEIHPGPALVVFSSGDEADCVITHVASGSGQFKIDGPLRDITRRRFVEPPEGDA